MISFNVPPYIGEEEEYVCKAIRSQKISGDGAFTKLCQKQLEEITGIPKALLTTSCSDALELAALLSGIQPGDEVIMPSFTFVSTANAFVLRGAKIVFVDIEPKTMNLNANLIEDAITEKTRIIVPVHYAGVGCDMDEINRIARENHLLVIEDAAQGVLSSYNGRALGTFGDYGCYSFHETKNYSMGEGGAILLKDDASVERAEIFREKGTNRSQFWRGQVDKYTWVDFGSSFLPSELNAAYLYPQLLKAAEILENRLASWRLYQQALEPLRINNWIETPYIPDNCEHNAHMFYIKTKDLAERTSLIRYLREHGVEAVFHYVPLHTSPAGRRFGRFHGEDIYTTSESDRLVRLPMYYGLKPADIQTVAARIRSFFEEKNG